MRLLEVLCFLKVCIPTSLIIIDSHSILYIPTIYIIKVYIAVITVIKITVITINSPIRSKYKLINTYLFCNYPLRY